MAIVTSIGREKHIFNLPVLHTSIRLNGCCCCLAPCRCVPSSIAYLRLAVGDDILSASRRNHRCHVLPTLLWSSIGILAFDEEVVRTGLCSRRVRRWPLIRGRRARWGRWRCLVVLQGFLLFGSSDLLVDLGFLGQSFLDERRSLSHAVEHGFTNRLSTIDRTVITSVMGAANRTVSFIVLAHSRLQISNLRSCSS